MTFPLPELEDISKLEFDAVGNKLTPETEFKYIVHAYSKESVDDRESALIKRLKEYLETLDENIIFELIAELEKGK